jgi:hypothetical protein
VRDGVLEHHLESAKRRLKIAQIVIPWSKVKELLGELLGGFTVIYIYIYNVSKTLDEVRPVLLATR